MIHDGKLLNVVIWLLTATVQQIERWSAVCPVSPNSTSFLCCCKLRRILFSVFSFRWLLISTTTTILRPFFRDHPGEPVPEENFWTLWCKGRLTEADTPTVRMGATPSGLTSAHLHHPPVFYRPDALPATQPTVTKHWRQLAHSD